MGARNHDWRRVGKATNWHPGGIIKTERQPNMMGEGVGNCLGLEGPKYTLDAKELERRELGDLVYEQELREERKLKRQREKDHIRSFEEVLSTKEAEGHILVDQRVFYTTWHKKDWEARAERVGGIPEGVDVAKTDFGLLLMVPVIEEDTAKELGINKKVPGVKQRQDAFGRPFWVKAELKDALSGMFGAIQWSRPLSIEEAKQFGVKIQ